MNQSSHFFFEFLIVRRLLCVGATRQLHLVDGRHGWESLTLYTQCHCEGVE